MRISDWSSDVCSSDLLSSPIDIIRTAHCVRSESGRAILFHPGSQHHGNGARVLLRHGACGVQVFFVAADFGRALLVLTLLLAGGLLLGLDRKSTRLNSSH